MKKNDYEIYYLSSFENELDEIIYYISNILKYKKDASSLLKNIEDSIKERSKNPEIYEVYKSGKEREFVWYRMYVKNFSIFYMVKDNVMEIAHIIYSKRDIQRYI